MGLEGLDQAARPAFALQGELLELRGHIGEGQGVLGVADAVALFEQGPGDDDVFADAFRPAADLFQGGAGVEGEGALGHQAAVIHGLHPLHGGDAVEIVPLLGSGQEVFARVAHHNGAGDGDGVGRVGQQTLDDLGQAVVAHPGIAVDGDDQVVLRRLHSPVQHGGLARIDGVVEHADRGVGGEAQLANGLLRQGDRGVGRAVVEDQDFVVAGIGLGRQAGQGVADGRGLVIGGDQDADGRIGGGPDARQPAVEQQGAQQEGVHEARHIGDEADGDQGEGPTRHRRQVVEPPLRQPDAQGGPGEGQHQGQGELGGHRQIEAAIGPRGHDLDRAGRR
ncbi:hypothetical protein D3C87_1277600 [compost metagenome]